MDFLGIGGWEIFLIIIIVLILFGPGKIVSVARTLGKIARSFRKITSDLTDEIARETDIQEKNEVTSNLHKKNSSETKL